MHNCYLEHSTIEFLHDLQFGDVFYQKSMVLRFCDTQKMKQDSFNLITFIKYTFYFQKANLPIISEFII